MLTSDVGGAKNSASTLPNFPQNPGPSLDLRDVRAGIGLPVSSRIGSNGESMDLGRVDLGSSIALMSLSTADVGFWLAACISRCSVQMQFSPTGSIVLLCLSVVWHLPPETISALASRVVAADPFFEVRKGILVCLGLIPLCTECI